jgi:HTH-type transcriptional regulator, sugar sensing transcriptional regulator
MEIPFLTKGESKVYETLVELGESSIGSIIKVSGVSSSKIYDILERLSKKGLVSSINKNGKQYFSSANPDRLNEILVEEKKKFEDYDQKLKMIVNNLNSRKNISKPLSILSSYEGIHGMKTVLDSVLESLRKGDEILILGSPRSVGEQAGGYLKDWQKRRIKNGAVCRIITDMDAISWEDLWWEKSKKKKLTFTKKSNSVSPSYLVITKDLVVTVYFSGVILTFMVEHKDIASRYIDFFNNLWNSSSK